MPIIQRYNPVSGQFDFVNIGGGSTITVVANYSALPAVGSVSGQFYWCSASQGTSWLPGSFGGTYYSAGLYYSNGVSWEFLDVPYQATQAEVNTGTNTDKFVTPDTLTNSTQLQYLDATSSIQTQLNAKQTTADFFAFASNTYADSTSYYLGQSLNPVTATSQTGGVALKAGVITACIISVYNAGTVASNESCTLNLVHGTNYGTTSLIANDVKIDANKQSARYVSGLNITVTECSSLININTPVLATNPNGLQLRITIFYA